MALSLATSCDTIAEEMSARVQASRDLCAYSWTGWYFGGNVGYAWGRDTGGLWRSWTDVPGSNYTVLAWRKCSARRGAMRCHRRRL